MKGARLLIPSTLRKKVLEQIHDGHLGIEKCMLKARDSVFWPGISNDICEAVEKNVKFCPFSFQSSQNQLENVSDVPPYAWHTFGHRFVSIGKKIDYLVIGGGLLLQVPDCEETSLNSFHTHGDQGIRDLSSLKLGRPFILRSDNGPCYSSG